MNPDVERVRELLATDPTLGRHRLHDLTGLSQNRVASILRGIKSGGAAPAASAIPPAFFGAAPSQQPDESVEETDRKKVYTLPKTRIHTLEQLIEFFEVDTTQWQVERFVCNKWEVGAKDAAKVLQIEPLYQVKATFVKKVEQSIAAVEIRQMIEDAKVYVRPKFEIIHRTPERSGNIVEVSIFDLHVGKLAWAPECGADYDSKIAKGRFWDALHHIAEDTRHHRPERIIFPLGNDLLQTDGDENETKRGTRVDSDSRHKKTFRDVLKMAREGVDYLREIAPVDVIMVPGNHDEDSIFFLGEALDCWFHGAKDVTVDNTPTMRKVVEWGQCLLQFMHGDKGKQKNFPLLMAAERSEAWGRTKYREIHVGHWHKMGSDETNGVVVRVIPSLCSADAWHSQMGFIGNLQRAEGYIWNRNRGLIGTSIYSVVEDAS